MAGLLIPDRLPFFVQKTEQLFVFVRVEPYPTLEQPVVQIQGVDDPGLKE